MRSHMAAFAMSLMMSVAATAAGPLTLEARHEHWRGFCAGKLTVDDSGVAFESAKKEGHNWRWGWLDIQQLQLLDNGELSLLTYKDNKWRLGADREFHFRLADQRAEAQAGALLGRKLERRFVLGAAAAPENVLWELPVKHLRRVSGTEGTLLAAEDRIVYKADRPGDSRTWYWQDIESISASGPYQLTITSFERARAHYGDRKGFNFELKLPLAEDRYNDLWRRVERAKGLEMATAAGEAKYAR
ncbi:MAG TPA: hypothetical protein VEU62_02015 [Bryobacterales bacterium]|nr:hypothetical protein [Bryobacterales bacterium]